MINNIVVLSILAFDKKKRRKKKLILPPRTPLFCSLLTQNDIAFGKFANSKQNNMVAYWIFLCCASMVLFLSDHTKNCERELQIVR